MRVRHTHRCCVRCREGAITYIEDYVMNVSYVRSVRSSNDLEGAGQLGLTGSSVHGMIEDFVQIHYRTRTKERAIM